MQQEFLEEKSWVDKFRIAFWILVIAGIVLVLIILLKGQKLVVRTPGTYQAVFLDNNQVYFGKLKSVNRDFLSLTDIYYLKAGTLQGAAGSQTAGQSNQEIDLIKLGSELHAPRDEMIINKQHVIFYEELSESGQVMQLIKKHEAGK